MCAVPAGIMGRKLVELAACLLTWESTHGSPDTTCTLSASVLGAPSSQAWHAVVSML